MTWRRCSEEMPEPGETVLVLVDGMPFLSACGMPAFAMHWNEKWWVSESWWGRRQVREDKDVRWWQPITPPDEGTAREGEGE